MEQQEAAVEEHGLAQLHGHQVAAVWMLLLLLLLLLLLRLLLQLQLQRHQLQSPQ